MRRLVLVCSIICLCFQFWPALAQNSPQQYTSEALGVAFQVPGGWIVRDFPDTQTIQTGSQADLNAAASGQLPAGLIFTLTITSFRQLGITRVGDLGTVLAQIAPAEAAVQVQISTGSGLVAETQDAAQDVSARTAILSIGKRRIAVLRGFSSRAAWLTGGRQALDAIFGSVQFFDPITRSDVDNVGQFLWSLLAPNAPNIMDIALTRDEATLFVTDRANGVWTVGANGSSGDMIRLDGIGAYGGIAIMRDGRKYLADPQNRVVWVVAPDTNRARRWISKANTFYGDAPLQFAFGLDGVIFFVDNVDTVPRVLIFGSNGALRDIWYLQAYAPNGITAPQVMTDDDGSLYVTGSNLRGIIKFSAGGGLITADLGAAVLNGSVPLSVAVDRFGNIFIGTADRGVLKINQAGELLGVIGEPYDEAAPPKPGQLGKPVALAVTADGETLYMGDAGAYPQIVAFSLANNPEINLVAGNRQQEVISYGQEVSALITATAFVFEYPFQARRGDIITITLRATDPAALDVYVDLLDPKGRRIAASDDSNTPGLAPTDAVISRFTLSANGKYTIRATRFGRESSRQVGSFSLKLEKNE